MENFFTRAPSHYTLSGAMHCLASCHPRTQLFSIGRTALGRDIQALSIGPVQGASLLVGGVHGSEWLTTVLLMRFCRDLLRGLETGQHLANIDLGHCLRGRSLVLVPCLNPDGMEIAVSGPTTAGILTPLVEPLYHRKGDKPWQANARGVDINHNFPAGWEELHALEQEKGITCPCHSRYGGTTPASEAETKAIMRLCCTGGIRQLYAFHAQGEEIYYHYGQHTPPRAQLMAQILASSCGYKVASPKGMAAHGGLKDWFIESLRRPGFTIEIGRGQNPLPIEELEPIYARLIETMVLSVIL